MSLIKSQTERRKKLRMIVDPMELELVARGWTLDLLSFADEAYPYFEYEEFVFEMFEAMNQASFEAFYLGKTIAADEAQIEYWSIEENDMPLLRTVRERHRSHLTNLMRDVRQSLNEGKDIKWADKKFKTLVQSIIRTSYNQGKVALWDDKLFEHREETRRQYDGFFMWVTHPEESTVTGVCPICAPLAATLALDYEDFPIPIFETHIGCNCEIVFSPLVDMRERQLAIRRGLMKRNYTVGTDAWDKHRLGKRLARNVKYQQRLEGKQIHLECTHD